MSESFPNTTIILAGGRSERLGAAGRLLPKPLMLMIDKPVINFLIEKTCALTPEMTVYVLAKKKWQKPDQDIEPAFKVWETQLRDDRWKAEWNKDKVQLKFEEDLTEWAVKGKSGTIPAINALLTFLEEKKGISGHFLVLQGDNFFDDNLQEFKTLVEQEFSKLPQDAADCVTCLYRIDDPEEVARFGVVRKTYDLGGRQLIAEFIEKPSVILPADRDINAGIYAFHQSVQSKLRRFVENIREEAFLGHFVEWLATGKSAQLSEKGAADPRRRVVVHSLREAWFDIGERRALTAAVSHYIETALAPILTIEDLKNHPREETNDKVFVTVACNKVEGTRNRPTLTLTLSPTEKLERKPSDLAQDATRRQELKDWLADLAAFLRKEPGTEKSPGSAPSGGSSGNVPRHRLLISGGVMLLDYPESPKTAFEGSLTRVPLQRRDLPARADPDRVTMPAGRLDCLSLTDLCFEEAHEEMLFYGGRDSARRRVFCLATDGMNDPRLSCLRRILGNKGITIPGLDDSELSAALTEENLRRALIEPIHIAEYNLKHVCAEPYVFEVTLQLKDDSSGKPAEVLDEGWFFVFLDELTGTLEFRKVAYADISEAGQNPIESPGRKFGRLAGVADGDGYGRIPMFFDARDLIRFYSTIAKEDQQRLFSRLSGASPDELHVLASGTPGTGRFDRFDYQIPLIEPTVTVDALLKFLPAVVQD